MLHGLCTGGSNTRTSVTCKLPMQIYLDIGVASSAFKPANDRMLGDKNVLPTDAEPAGRIIIGKQRATPFSYNLTAASTARN